MKRTLRCPGQVRATFAVQSPSRNSIGPNVRGLSLRWRAESLRVRRRLPHSLAINSPDRVHRNFALSSFEMGQPALACLPPFQSGLLRAGMRTVTSR